MTTLNSETLAMLRCPVTQSKLTIASDEQVAAVNQKIEAKEIFNRLGQCVTDPIDGLLISEDGSTGSAVRNGIVQMIADEAIAMPQSA